MASTGVKLGHGSTIRIGRGATPAWTNITGADTVSFPEQQRADVDVTCLTSPDETEESIPGLRSASDWSIDKHYVQGDAQDVLLLDLEDTGETIILEITPIGGTAVKWTAYVKGWTPTLPSKSQMMATLTLRVMAKVAA